jgi:hypothetical protein
MRFAAIDCIVAIVPTLAALFQMELKTGFLIGDIVIFFN